MRYQWYRLTSPRERKCIKDQWSLDEGALKFDEGGAGGAWFNDEA